MDKKQILEFISTNPSCHLATIEKGEPRVRGMLLYRADEEGLVFHTGSTKDLNKQLEANPTVEICFANQTQNPAEVIQIRVRGSVEPIEDPAYKKQVVEDRPFMKPWVEARGIDFLKIYRMKRGLASVWTFATNLEPSRPIEL